MSSTVLAVIGLVVKFFVLSPQVRPAPTVTAPKTPEAIAHGKYLVDHVAGCLGCHSPVQDDKPGDYPVEGKLGAGRDFGAFPGSEMRFRSHNLTPAPQVLVFLSQRLVSLSSRSSYRLYR